jgi:uncharacterized SAM-binding protein YcdF (DUF218 family)
MQPLGKQNKKRYSCFSMKHTTISLLLFFFAAISTGYYGILTADSLSIISFSLVWVLIGALFCVTGIVIQIRKKSISTSRQSHKNIKKILFVLSGVAAGLTIPAVFFIMTPSVSNTSQSVRYILVLGGGLRGNGTLGEIPLNRIKVAARYLKIHPETKAVVTGGKGRHMPIAEAPVLAEALIQQGVPVHQIIQEEKALDTIQNFYYSTGCIAADRKITADRALEEPVMIITSRFHLARAELIARRTGFKTVYGIDAPVSPIFVLNAYCREIAACIKLAVRLTLTGKPSRSFTINQDRPV